MYRTKTCGELRIENAGEQVTLAGWVQKNRDLGGMTFIDLRDRFGLTQLAFNMEDHSDLCLQARELGREFVVQAEGKVVERQSKNKNIPTGEIEIEVSKIQILNAADTPPFIIEDQTDGGEEIRMKYRYLDLRRNPLKNNILLRHKLAIEIRNYLNNQLFIEVETPVLIKSTPEGARDFVVPSRMHQGEFYALPQSPQTFKQLLMVSGFDRYFQIVRCFRDEDLRADRQPEFTQIDCEMSFVDRDDVLLTFENMVRHLFKNVKGIQLPTFPRMTYANAMKNYGNDKPDIRFEMTFKYLNHSCKGRGFGIFDQAESVIGISVPECSEYSRKQLDEIIDWVKRPQIGAKGLVYIKCNTDGTFKSSVDKFYTQVDLGKIAEQAEAKAGDLIFIMSGNTSSTQKQMSELRLRMGRETGLAKSGTYAPLWVVDFPLLEWDETTNRYHAMHHPFTSPNVQGENWYKDPKSILANAYDMVINGVELGGGSIRIHDKKVQAKMFELLGFSDEEAKKQFGFLMNAFEYGAPPHGGIAFGFDRLCAMFGGTDSIRDYIAFPKNNAGRDMMIEAPDTISGEQLVELGLEIKKQ
ncbi:MAG: aspartate--tRNA ligase [Flavobacteriales bacterium]|nr:aspartate--tRNA ligase [Flavobacteriales bacterium]